MPTLTRLFAIIAAVTNFAAMMSVAVFVATVAVVVFALTPVFAALIAVMITAVIQFDELLTGERRGLA